MSHWNPSILASIYCRYIHIPRACYDHFALNVQMSVIIQHLSNTQYAIGKQIRSGLPEFSVNVQVFNGYYKTISKT